MELERCGDAVVLEMMRTESGIQKAACAGVRGAAMKGFGSDRGVSLIETLIAVFIALVGIFSLGSLVFQASATQKNQGTETTRCVIYAQDKIEKLLSLAAVPTVTGQPDFATCNQTPSSQPSQCNTTGITSVTGWTTGLVAGGLITPLQPTCPSTGSNVGYMDFLNPSGVQEDACASPTTTVAYIREWHITDLTSTTVPAFFGGPVAKQIDVAVYSIAAVNTNGGQPIVVLTSTVSNPCKAGSTCP